MTNNKNNKRETALKQWSYGLVNALTNEKRSAEGLPSLEWQMVSGDASFRRYFRVLLKADKADIESTDANSWIAVDAPPDKENNEAFVDVLKRLEAQNVSVPRLLEVDYQQGFMLLSDLGDQLLLPLLDDDSVDNWYQSAMEQLLGLQQSRTDGLMRYDQEKLRQEMNLFHEWFLPQYLQLPVGDVLLALLDQVYNKLELSALEQPQCFVHRDYHGRNLMVLNPTNYQLGVIDFQDAVVGPMTYDLVSLLKDCYKKWPPERVDQWALGFKQLCTERLDSKRLGRKLQGMSQVDVTEISDQQWLTWFDWMGLQRHIKVAGIFSRLYYRDGKSGYLADIPRTVRYIVDVLERYPKAFEPFYSYMKSDVLPALIKRDPAAAEWFSR